MSIGRLILEAILGAFFMFVVPWLIVITWAVFQ